MYFILVLIVLTMVAVCLYKLSKPLSEGQKEAERFLAQEREKAEEMKRLALEKAAREKEEKKAEELRKAKETGQLNEGDTGLYFPFEKIEDEWKAEGDRRRINDVFYKDMEVRGTSYRGIEAMYEASLLDKGAKLLLEPEPQNERDPNAVKILTEGGTCIGYVPADIAQQVGEHLKDLAFCRVRRRKSEGDKVWVDACVGFYWSKKLDIILFDQNLKLRNYYNEASVETYMGRYSKAAELFKEEAERSKTPQEKYEAYKRACMCYRKDKDYEAEYSLIDNFLDYDTEGFTKAQINFFKRRLEQAKDKSLFG